MIHCTGIIHEVVPIYNITDDIKEALEDPDSILITTPAHSHRGLAELIAKNINKST